MNIKCLIVDDEEPARDELAFFLSKIDYVDIAGEADSVKNAFLKINELEPDLVFLDIEMPGNNGFFLIEKLKDLKHIPYIIFATAYNEYAVKAFEADAVDYLLKPFSFERIKDAVERVRKRKGAGSRNLEKLAEIISEIPAFSKIPLEKNGRMVLVSPEEVFFFESSGKDISAWLEDRTLFLPREATMDKLEKRLVSKNFFRPHRSYLINLNKIDEFYSWFGGKYELVMSNRKSSKIPVSRNRVKAFKKIVSAW